MSMGTLTETEQKRKILRLKIVKSIHNRYTEHYQIYKYTES